MKYKISMKLFIASFYKIYQNSMRNNRAVYIFCFWRLQTEARNELGSSITIQKRRHLGRTGEWRDPLIQMEAPCCLTPAYKTKIKDLSSGVTCMHCYCAFSKFYTRSFLISKIALFISLSVFM